MIEAPVTTVLVAFFAAWLVSISAPVSFRRMATKTSIGTGDDEALQRLIRAQGNFIEYVPTALIAILLVELSQAPVWLVWTLGGLLAAGRLAHAVGMLKGSHAIRASGMILTYACLLTSAGALASAAIN